jgi:hypothetical protein
MMDAQGLDVLPFVAARHTPNEVRRCPVPARKADIAHRFQSKQLAAVMQEMPEMKMDIFNESAGKTDFLEKKVRTTPPRRIAFQEAQLTCL